MIWAKWIFAYLFDCVHLKTTWPRRARNGLDYVCCVNCGKEFPYSTLLMRIVTKEELLRDRSQYDGVERSNVRPLAPAVSVAKMSIDPLLQ